MYSLLCQDKRKEMCHKSLVLLGTLMVGSEASAAFAHVNTKTQARSRSYHLPIYSEKVSVIDKAGGAIYRQSVLTDEELLLIKEDVSKASSHLHKEVCTIAQNRVGASLPSCCDTVKILSNGSLCQLVRRVTGDDTMILSSNLQVQVRSYVLSGASMAWHVDDVLYDPPQIEVVFTVENNSDCVTMYKEGERLHSIETDPNSVLMLRAGGPLHCVTSLKRGRRVILKCAYTSEGATFLESDAYSNNFKAVKSKKLSSRRNKR